jgi:hypothetical protein
MTEKNKINRKEELQNELEKLKDLKNEAIKTQQYDYSANLREKQREVEEELKKLNQQN